MKRIVFILLAALVMGTAAFAYFQWLDVQERDLKIANLTQALSDANAARELAEKNARSLADDLKAREEASRLAQGAEGAKKVASASDGAASGASPLAAKPGGSAESLAQMFRTEGGRKMLKSQTETKTRMMFGSLVKGLHLSPEDGNLVMGLLTDRNARLSEAVFAATDASVNATNEQRIASLSATAEQVRAEYDQKLKATLGEEKFQQMKAEEGSVGDRLTLAMAQSQFSASPLTEDQRESLLSIMTDTRKTLPPPVFDPTGQDVARGLRALQDDTSEERHLTQEAAYQQKVLQAATSTLNPDQITALQKGFEQALQQQKFRIEMSKQMFAKPTAAPVSVK